MNSTGHSIRNGALSLRNVSLTYGADGRPGLPILKDISLNVDFGEIHAIMGPSGCGKSPLMRIIAGVESGHSGQLLLGSGDGLGPERLATYLAQDDVLLPFRTALQNVALPLELGGRLTPGALSAARELLRRFGLSEFQSYAPAELSGGMQRRLLLARHIVHDRPILLLDEPFNGLDTAWCWKVAAFLDELRRGHDRAILIVVHDIALAAALSDRIYVLSGRPATVIEEHVPASELMGLSPKARRVHPLIEQLELKILKSFHSLPGDSLA